MLRRSLQQLNYARKAARRRVRFTRWSRCIGDAYLAAQFPESQPFPVIHARDDMLRVIRQWLPQPENARILYFKSGYDALRSLQNVLARVDRPLDEMNAVLDFACGFGRVTRFLKRELGSNAHRLQSCDILPDAVAFLRRRMGVSCMLSAADPRAVQFDEAFDLIFVTSFFTHLPEDSHRAWLRKLYDALSPRGILVFSTNSVDMAPRVSKEHDRYQFHTHSESARLDGRDYGTSYIPPAIVRSMAKEDGVAHLYTLERDLWALQDLHVAAREPLPGLADWRPTSNVDGAFDILEIGSTGSVRAFGWVADRRDGAPVEDVELVCAGRRLGRVVLDQERPDVARVRGRPEYRRAGFALEADGALVPRRNQLILAVARSNGDRHCFDARLTRPGALFAPSERGEA